jgi:hypothetical protein
VPSALRLVASLVTALALAAACSSDERGVLESSAPSSQTTSPSSTSADNSTASTGPASSTSSDAAADPQGAVDTWIQLLDAAKTGEPTDDEIATIRAIADASTVEQLLTPLFPDSPSREITPYPAPTQLDDGTIAIDDCVVMNRGISTGISNWFTALATPNPDSPTGWTISDVTLINLQPCVPRSIADAAIADYEAHWNARESFFNPPNSDEPQLRGTTTGPALDRFLEIIDQFEREGLVSRGNRHSTNPEFSEFNAADEVVLVDCQDANPEYGIYDVETGERTALIEAVVDGQLNLARTTMTFEDGVWKVSGVNAQNNVQCRTPPTPPTLRISGG